jgi:molecular chaperone HtpG
MEKGNISVSTENIFPIIKKSLYSDHEIFLRELVANAIDATQKLKSLHGLGEFDGELGDMKISVSLDKEAGTLTISDNGLGMTGEEVKKYLNQVAFSGAEEFLRKYKDLDSKDEIIGKFGLGFYSAFMVAKEVEVVSQSFHKDAPAVRWTCDGTTEYTLEETERAERGTDIILHVNEDDKEFLEDARIQGILEKYCKFLPVPIEFKEEIINQTHPIWRKAPTELEDEDYLSLFRTLYPMAEEPLFWIHLNVDFPFSLNGVLYFPKIRQDIDPRRNNIQLYSRQVFITDEVEQIVPEYLMLLQGVIDSPDIPLNVSRSYLQSDSNVRKISSYITRKVGDKLLEIYREDRAKFEEKWPDISVFVKYGMLTDDNFYEKAEKFCLLENVDGNFFGLEEYREKIAPKQTDKDENVVYLYATDKEEQHMFISAAGKRDYDVLHLNNVLDSHFIGLLERKLEKGRFVRVDSDTIDKLIPQGEEEEKPEDGIVLSEEQEGKIKEAFLKANRRPEINIQTQALAAEDLPVTITRPEFMRRMKEMAAAGGGMAAMGQMPDNINLIVNTKHPLVRGLVDDEQREETAKQMLDLALLSQQMLKGEALTAFIQRSYERMARGEEA